MTEASLHEVLARGIHKGLQDVGADLTGCTPATLTGHIIRELLTAGMHPGAPRRREPSADEPQWRIGIEVPMRIPGVLRDELFERVAALVHRWEPDERDRWDANVYGCPAVDDAPDHLVAAERDAAVRESAVLRGRLSLVVTELLRGGMTYADRCRSAYRVLSTEEDAVCRHGRPRVLVECSKCDAVPPLSASVAPQTEET